MNKLLWRRSHSSLFLYISLFCVPVNRFLNRLCLLLFQQPADLFCRRVAVSYTHLDVYKRQLYACLLEYVKEKGCKNGQALCPIRIAMSGKQTTPCGASEMMEVLGKEESLKRRRAAIEKLENENA